MTTRVVRSSLLMMALLLTSTGCYRYIPVEAAAVPQGENIRVSVTRLGAEQFSQITPDGLETGTITGTMAGIENDDLMLSVAVGERREGFMTSALQQTIRVPMGEILDVDRRELDGLATGAVIGVAAAGVAAIIFGIMDAFGSEPGPGEEDPPADFTFGLFSLPIGG